MLSDLIVDIIKHPGTILSPESKFDLRHKKKKKKVEGFQISFFKMYLWTFKFPVSTESIYLKRLWIQACHKLCQSVSYEMNVLIKK